MADGPISNKALCFVWWQKINEQTRLTFPTGRTLIWRPSEDPHCPVYPAKNGWQWGNMYSIHTIYAQWLYERTHKYTYSVIQRARSEFHKLPYLLLIRDSFITSKEIFSLFFYAFYLKKIDWHMKILCWHRTRVRRDLNCFLLEIKHIQAIWFTDLQ